MAGVRRTGAGIHAGPPPAPTAAGEPAALVRVQLLGGFSVTVGAQDIPPGAWRLQKARALVKLLALAPGHRMHRERVMEILWPDLDPDAAANNLYISLHVARRALLTATPTTRATTGLLRLNQHVVSLDALAGLWIDVEAFEAAAASAHAAHDPAAYRQALALYTGDLLPDDRYDDWVISRREALRESYLSLLFALARHAESQQDYPAAVESLQRALAAEPTREEAHVGLMRVYALSGQRADALRQYTQLEAALRRELDAEPDAASRDLRDAIAAGRFPQSQPQPAADSARPSRTVMPSGNTPTPAPATPGGMPSAAPLSSPPVARASPALSAAPHPHLGVPLIGRRPEVSRLMAAWRVAREAPHLALVSGDPGVGKTRLAVELLARAESQGVLAATARCYAAGGELSYAPVAAWLRSNAHWPALFSLGDLWLTEVARLIPEILVERPSLSPPGPLGESWQRQRLFEALCRALTATGRPQLLLLDDLHWCDRETREWLHYFVRSQQPNQPEQLAPLLVIATLRPEDAAGQPELIAFLEELRGSGRLTDVELGPLSAADTLALGEKILDRAPSAAAAARLVAESEGSPLFVVQLVRAGYVDRWEREAQPGNTSSAAGPATSASAAAQLPPTLQSAIAARLDQLSPPTRELAGVAATIGREFSVELLAQAGALDEDALVRGVEELLQRRIVREHPSASGDYDFAHDKIREVAYGTLSTARRRVLHRRIARALETLHAGTLDAVSGQIASHYLKGGEPAKAVVHLERAGDYARRLYANVEAEGYYRELVARLEALGRQDDAARVREKLGETLAFVSRFDAAIEKLAQADAYYEAAGDLEKVGSLTASIVRMLALKGAPVEGLARAHDFLNRDGSKGLSSHTLAALYHALNMAHMTAGQPKEQLETIQQAVELARQAGDQRLLGDVEIALGVALFNWDRHDEALAAFLRAIPLLEREGELGQLFYAVNDVGAIYDSWAEYDKSRVYIERAAELAEQIGDPGRLSFILRRRGINRLGRGDWVGARQDLERAVALMGTREAARVDAFILLGLALLNLAQGRKDQALRQLEDALALEQRLGATYSQWMAERALAEVDLLEGHADSAGARLEPFRDQALEQGGELVFTLPWLAWAYLGLGELTQASMLLEHTITHATASHMRLAQMEALLVRARLETQRARWQEAASDLDASVSLARAMPYPYGEAQALYIYGLLHSAKGEPDLARERLTASLAILTSLGERLYAEHVEHALAALH